MTRAPGGPGGGPGAILGSGRTASARPHAGTWGFKGRVVLRPRPPGLEEAPVQGYAAPGPTEADPALHLRLGGRDGRLDRIEARLAAVEEALSGFLDAPAGAAPAPREIGDEEAKDEIKAYFAARDGAAIYPDEVAEALGIDLLRAVRLCEALVAEGRLGRG